jgi:hypothetical protein
MTMNEPPSLDDDEQDPPEPEDARLSRRERAEFESRQRALQLENLMLRAGIDPNTGLGKLFYNGYQGDLTIDAVRASAIEAQVIPDPNAEEPPPPDPNPPLTPDERGSTQERQLTAVGAQPDGGVVGEDLDPRVRAVLTGFENLDAGGTTESAMGVAFDEIASAAYNDHDKRAIYTPGEPDPRRPDLGW